MHKCWIILLQSERGGMRLTIEALKAGFSCEGWNFNIERSEVKLQVRYIHVYLQITKLEKKIFDRIENDLMSNKLPERWSRERVGIQIWISPDKWLEM